MPFYAHVVILRYSVTQVACLTVKIPYITRQISTDYHNCELAWAGSEEKEWKKNEKDGQENR